MRHAEIVTQPGNSVKWPGALDLFFLPKWERDLGMPTYSKTKRELAGEQIDIAEIYPLAGGWSVPSDTGHRRYIVTLNDEDRRRVPDEQAPWDRRPQCTCMDHRVRHARCKHICAVFRLLAAYEITMGEATQEYETISRAAQEWQ